MKKIFLFGFALLILSSCYKEINLSNENNTDIVVSAFIAKDSLIKVILQKTMPVNSASQKVYITDATIKLYEDEIEVDNLTLFNSTYEINGLIRRTYYYVSDKITAKTGKTYRIEVITAEGKQITGKTSIPESVEITALDTTFRYTVYLDENYLDFERNFRIRFKDPEGKNYYRLTAMERSCSIKGKDTICRRESSLDFFEQDSLLLYFGKDNENEFFSSASNNFMIFDDKTINGREYELKLSSTTELSNLPHEGDFIQYVFELQSITKEGYSYLKAIDLQGQTGGLMTEPVMPYTNINNGVGIFTGYSASKKVITIDEFPVDEFVYK